MRLTVVPYQTEMARRPAKGKQIFAQYDDDHIVVYQAYRQAIGHFGADHGRFGGGFALNRMTWIKPSFLWMMYRSGWGTKIDQETVLAIWLTRSGFDHILSQAVLTTFDPAIWADAKDWKRNFISSDVRLQWDPDRTATGHRCGRRAIQLGLRGEVLRTYTGYQDPHGGKRWIAHIEDISTFVAEQRTRVGSKDYEGLLIPREEIYPVHDPQIARRIMLNSTSGTTGRLFS